MHQAAARNLEPVLKQNYLRDTGEAAWDVSAPIFVKGRHFGAFRVAVSRDSIAAHKRSLLLQLVVVFGFLTVITASITGAFVTRSTRERDAALAPEPLSETHLQEIHERLDRIEAMLRGQA